MYMKNSLVYKIKLLMKVILTSFYSVGLIGSQQINELSSILLKLLILSVRSNIFKR